MIVKGEGHELMMKEGELTRRRQQRVELHSVTGVRESKEKKHKRALSQ